MEHTGVEPSCERAGHTPHASESRADRHSVSQPQHPHLTAPLPPGPATDLFDSETQGHGTCYLGAHWESPILLLPTKHALSTGPIGPRLHWVPDWTRPSPAYWLAAWTEPLAQVPHGAGDELGGLTPFLRPHPIYGACTYAPEGRPPHKARCHRAGAARGLWGGRHLRTCHLQAGVPPICPPGSHGESWRLTEWACF